MVPPMSSSSLLNFLAIRRPLLADERPKTVVLGNEAADLDSMVSTLVYSYLLASISNERRQIVPLLSLPRADFPLRTEAFALFQQLTLPLTDLIFIDEVDLGTLLRDDGRLVLVDHNRLAMDHDLGEQVHIIIDHHEDEQLYPQAILRRIEPVGSTATLVYEEICQHQSTLLDYSVATLLLAAILLDTANLNKNSGRVSQADEQAAQALSLIHGADPDKLFHHLHRARFAWQHLSSRDLLRRDMKRWRLDDLHGAISSLPLSVHDWQAKEAGFAQTVAVFAAEQDLDALLTMHVFFRPQLCRQLGIYASTPAIHDRLLTMLQQAGVTLTALDAIIYDSLPGILSFHNQNDEALSRKKILPLFSKFCTTPKSESRLHYSVSPSIMHEKS